MTTKREFQEREHYYRALQSLGFTYTECEQLRRISLELQPYQQLRGQGLCSVAARRVGGPQGCNGLRGARRARQERRRGSRYPSLSGRRSGRISSST